MEDPGLVAPDMDVHLPELGDDLLQELIVDAVGQRCDRRNGRCGWRVRRSRRAFQLVRRVHDDKIDGAIRDAVQSSAIVFVVDRVYNSTPR